MSEPSITVNPNRVPRSTKLQGLQPEQREASSTEVTFSAANQKPHYSSVYAASRTSDLVAGLFGSHTRPQAACCPSKFNPLKSLLNALYPNLLLGNPFDIIYKYAILVKSEG